MIADPLHSTHGELSGDVFTGTGALRPALDRLLHPRTHPESHDD